MNYYVIQKNIRKLNIHRLFHSFYWLPQPCQNVSRQKFVQEMLTYDIMFKKCIYTVIYAYAQKRGISSRLYTNITIISIKVDLGIMEKACW